MDSVTEPSSSAKPTLVKFPERHREFIIEDIMPAREVHIFAGASGCGKTTFLVQMIDDMLDGLTVFEQKTTRVNPVYLCNDRSHDDLRRTFERISPTHQYPVYSLVTDREFANCHSVPSILQMAKTLHPNCDFIAYDPISFNVENVNSAREVSSLLRSITKACQELNLTAVINHHTAKTKTDAMYANPRQKIAGSGAWGGYSNLNLIFEEEDDSDPTNPFRRLHICPRNGANRLFRFMQDENGCFVPAPKRIETGRRTKDDQVFNRMPLGEFGIPELDEALGSRSHGAVYRNIARWTEAGCVEKLKERGRFRKVKNAQ